MLHDMGLHASSGRLALSRSNLYGRTWIELRTVQGEVIGEIGPGYLPRSPRWSPDGTQVAFTCHNGGPLYLYSPGDTEPRVVFEDPFLLPGFCEWSPSGRELVFSAYDSRTLVPPDIYCLHLDTGQAAKLTDLPSAVDRFPLWSPSGQWIAFHRQHLEEPERPKWVHLLQAGSAASHALPAPPGTETRAGKGCWGPGSTSIIVTQALAGAAQIKIFSLPDRAPVWAYEAEGICGGAFAPGGERLLCVCRDRLLWFSYPAGRLLEILSLAGLSPVRDYFTGPNITFDREGAVLFLGKDSCLYRWVPGGDCVPLLREAPQSRPPFTHEEYTITARGGRPVPVQRFLPPHPRRPAVLFVHGGPHEAIDPDDPILLHLLREGFEVICAAYRGSAGYGEEHLEANRGEYGRGDVWDVIACGRDWKERLGRERPLVLCGYSYGGFLTLLALADAQAPWAGGVVLWTLSGLHRFEPHAQRALPPDPVERAAALLERSPLEQATHIHVPVLILHGRRDTVATVEEVQSIRQRIGNGGGTCELVVFDDDTHGLNRHTDEVQARIVDFLRSLEQRGAFAQRVEPDDRGPGLSYLLPALLGAERPPQAHAARRYRLGAGADPILSGELGCLPGCPMALAPRDRRWPCTPSLAGQHRSRPNHSATGGRWQQWRCTSC